MKARSESTERLRREVFSVKDVLNQTDNLTVVEKELLRSLNKFIQDTKTDDELAADERFADEFKASHSNP